MRFVYCVWCAEKVASFASTNSANGVTLAMNLNLAPVNLGNGYSTSLKSFTCPVTGLYWLFFTVVCAGQLADVTVVGTNQYPPPGIQRQHMTFLGTDTISASRILNLNEGF